MMNDKFYTRQLSRAKAFDNSEAIEYSQERLHKVQTEKESKLLGRAILFMLLFTIASPFLIYLFGLY